MLTEHRLFLKQFLRQYHSTGAIAPSSRWLARSLSRQLDATAGNGPRQILEVGPGTGAVTQHLVRRLAAGDRLTLVELNADFVAHLHERFEREPAFRHVAAQTQIVHKPVEQLDSSAGYDHIISGLPLNNFSVELVERILATFRRLMAPGGTVSFFEYMAVRDARRTCGPSADRRRLAGISRALESFLADGGIGRDWVWPNLPPAWVHHVQKPR